MGGLASVRVADNSRHPMAITFKETMPTGWQMEKDGVFMAFCAVANPAVSQHPGKPMLSLVPDLQH
jgi:hypothetical protein